MRSLNGCHAICVAACVMGAQGAWIAPAAAQNPPGAHQDNSGLNGSLSRGDLEKLNGDHKLQADADAKEESAQTRAKARAESLKLAETLRLACDVRHAKLVVAGTRKPASGGKEVETRVYEVACSGGFGYLLETQGTDAPIGISCLDAEEARAADVLKGREPGFFCRLPENRDVYATVSSLIAAGGGSCTVRDLKSFGRSEANRSQYSEVACEGGNGYLLRTPLPGSTTTLIVTSCADAAKQGIKCRMTDSGPVETPVTLDTFKAALGDHGVACKIDQIRMIGQEDHLKRYVVEYRCADQPKGMVAFLPLQGNTNPYESIDCATAAAEHQVNCEFAGK